MDHLVRAAIKRDLPAFPDEVIDSWLLPIAEDAGWPPVVFSRWDRVLGHRQLTFWKHVGWAKRQVPLAIWSIEVASLNRIAGLLDVNVHGLNNAYAQQLTGTQDRFDEVLSYLRQYGHLPVPPVLLQDGVQYEILDGHHRIAALLHVGASQFGAMCWVAQPVRLNTGLTGAWSRPA